MRLLILFILLIPIFSFSQTGTVKLKVREKNDKLNRGAWEYAWIYNTDTSYKQYSDIDKQKAFFDSLPADSYTVTIYSKFGNKEHQQNILIEGNQSIKLEFDIKSNPFTEYLDSVPLIDNLTESLVYSITWNMDGCFNWHSGWADITTKNGSYYIKTQNKDSVFTKVLPIYKIAYLGEIETRALTESPKVYCTDVYYYTFKLERELYTYRTSCFDLVGKLLDED